MRKNTLLLSVAILSFGCVSEPFSHENGSADAISGTFATVSACVDAHVQNRGGDAGAVTDLACPVVDSTPCAGVEPPDLAALARLPNLVSLDLSGRCIRDLAVITSLAKLERLEFARNALVEIRPLGALTKLKVLDLAGNPVASSWRFSTREPFSKLTSLEELVLDDTEVTNILPLAEARSLRTLSLKNLYIETIQPLVTLTGLRALHVDGTFISDLSPLSGMMDLAELTADDNLVRSVDPLVPLVARSLKRISLKGNCVASCNALSSAAYDCSGQHEGCNPAEPSPAKRAMPVDLIDRFAPSDLPTWTADELARAFQIARAATDIDWKSARNNCDARANALDNHLREASFPALTRAVAFGNLRPLSRNDPAGFVVFEWHIAVALRAATPDGGSALFVLDPALDDTRPLPLRDWYAHMADSGAGGVDFSCARYWTLIGETANAARCASPVFGMDQTTGTMLDSHGNYLADPLGNIRGAVCKKDVTCIPL